MRTPHTCQYRKSRRHMRERFCDSLVRMGPINKKGRMGGLGK